jgi:uncharacterized SAM-binding protein YcdF (DUF218 family)
MRDLSKANTALGGLFDRRERWSLSRRGWIGFAFLMALAGSFLFFFLHPFMAITDRVKTDTLVVEGWIHDYAIRAAAAEFTNGRYAQVYSTGGPVVGSGAYINDFNTSASVGADRLKATGLPPHLVHMVPSRARERERTYGAALALRRWFAEHGVAVRGFNVVTEGVHSRRTRHLFQKAFGPDVQVGVISIPNSEYDAQRWWGNSEGVKEVFTETAAYIYVRLFFWPDAPN